MVVGWPGLNVSCNFSKEEENKNASRLNLFPVIASTWKTQTQVPLDGSLDY